MMKNELIEKSIKVRQLFSEVDFPPTMTQFFDLDSDELLDEKIRVLTALKDGKQIAAQNARTIYQNFHSLPPNPIFTICIFIPLSPTLARNRKKPLTEGSLKSL